MPVFRFHVAAALLSAIFAASCASTSSSVSAAAKHAEPPSATPREDSFAAALAENPGRAAGLFHRYEFDDISDAAPPSGYEAFYISHYGRHGSRYQIDKKSFAVVDALEAGRKAGVLTPAGEALLDALAPIVAEHSGMYGQLSRLGAAEHRSLARRMHGRFPGVFAGGGAVRCRSSTIQRCLTSMANFACALKGEEPALDFSFETGDRVMAVILHPYLPSDARKKWLADFDRRIVVDNLPEPEKIVSRYFTDAPATREIIADPHRFAFDLFAAASSFESLTVELGGADLLREFSPSELVALGRARSCIHYAHMGNAAEYGHCAAWSAHDLALDIARRADEAISSGGSIRADLRFGHDSGLRPLAGLIGIDGAGDCSPCADSWRTCPTWKGMPMGSNLQIVFYRKPGADILVKVLYNERESAVDGLTAVAAGPYYKWIDLKKRLETPGGEPTGRGTLLLRLGDLAPAQIAAAESLLDKYGSVRDKTVAATIAAASAASDKLVEVPRGHGDVTDLVRACADGDGVLVLDASTAFAAKPDVSGEDSDDQKSIELLEKALLEARCRGVSVIRL